VLARSCVVPKRSSQMIRFRPYYIKSHPQPIADMVRPALPTALILTALLTASAALSAPVFGQARASTPRTVEQSSGTKELIQAVHAVNAQVVWAAGHGAVVLRTRDGGARWERLQVPESDSLEFRDVHALNADTAWILAAGAGTRSRIYRTNDGGATWALQFRNADTSAFYDCMTFLDDRRGLAYSDASGGRTRILRTENGGASWALRPDASVPAPLPGEGAFAASGLCVAAVPPSTAFIATGAPGARLFRSADAGLLWTSLETPFVRGAAAGLTGLSFTDANNGIAVAADISRLRTDTSSAVVGITADGGRTWSLRTRPPLPGALSGVAMVPAAGAESAVVVGFGGAFVTADGARTWTTIENAVFTGVAAFGRTAWIAGGGGRIVRLDW